MISFRTASLIGRESSASCYLQVRRYIQGGVYAARFRIIVFSGPRWLGQEHVLLFLPAQSVVSYLFMSRAYCHWYFHVISCNKVSISIEDQVNFTNVFVAGSVLPGSLPGLVGEGLTWQQVQCVTPYPANYRQNQENWTNRLREHSYCKQQNQRESHNLHLALVSTM